MFNEDICVRNSEGKFLFELPAVGALLLDLEHNEKSCTMNIPVCMKLKMPLDKAKLEKCVNDIIVKNDALRMSVHHDYRPDEFTDLIFDGKVSSEYKLWFRKEYKFRLVTVKAEGDSIDEKREDAKRIISGAVNERIDVFNDVPFRLRVVEVADDENWIFLAVHHSLCDPPTLALLLKSILGAYFAPASDEKAEVSTAYMEHLDSLEKMKDSEKYDRTKAFWSETFKGFTALKASRLSDGDSDGKDFQFMLDKKKLSEVAKANKTSVFNVAVLIFHLAFLIQYGSYDTALTYAFNARKDKSLAGVMGSFIEAVNSRVFMDKSQKIEDLHKIVRKAVADGVANDSAETGCYSPLMLSYQELAAMGMQEGGASSVLEPVSLEVPKLYAPGMGFTIMETADALCGNAVYNKEFFTSEVVWRFIELFKELEDIISEQPYLTVGELVEKFGASKNSNCELIEI